MVTRRTLVFLCFTALFIDSGVNALGKYRGLEFIEPCFKNSPNLEVCLTKSANVLTEHFRKGNVVQCV